MGSSTIRFHSEAFSKRLGRHMTTYQTISDIYIYIYILYIYIIISHVITFQGLRLIRLDPCLNATRPAFRLNPSQRRPIKVIPHDFLIPSLRLGGQVNPTKREQGVVQAQHFVTHNFHQFSACDQGIFINFG